MLQECLELPFREKICITGQTLHEADNGGWLAVTFGGADSSQVPILDGSPSGEEGGERSGWWTVLETLQGLARVCDHGVNYG